MNSTKKIPYYKKDSHWLLGSVPSFMASPHNFPAEAAKTFQGIAKIRLLHKKVICINHPGFYEHIMVSNHTNYERSHHFKNQQLFIGKGMLSTDGPEWAAKRSRGMPAFNREALKKMVPLSVNVTQKFLKEWSSSAEKNEAVSLVPEMQKITLSIICQSLFSVDVERENVTEFCDILREGVATLRRFNNSLFNFPQWVPTKLSKDLIRTRGLMQDFVLDRLAAREKLKSNHQRTHDIFEILFGGKTQKDMSAEELQNALDECKTLLIAGFETTALTLTWALHLLSLHPEVAAKWHAECDNVIKDEFPSWEDLDKLEYTKQVLFETMRLYPVVFTQPRIALNDDQLGPYKIKKGSLLLLSNYGIHRSKEHWVDAEEFKPERFAKGASWPRASFMPFGKGKHTCIGNNFSIYEMLVLLSMIGKKFSFERVTSEEIGIRPSLVLLPDRDILVKLRSRQ
jgi:cytochrome P450